MALKPLNSVGGFSVGEVPANIILANGDITGTNATFAGNLLISNSTATWGILTDNLYYSNGAPWDLGGSPAGSNNYVQYNINGEFAASANFTFDPATNLLTVAGNIDVANADLGNLVVANFADISSNIVTSNLTVNLELAGNTANFSGNLTAANGNLGNLIVANFANIASNTVTSNLTVNLELAGNTANFTGNVVTGNLNTTSVVASTLTSNVSTGTAPLTVSSTTKVTNLNADLLDGYDSSMSGTANTVAVRNADGNITANYFIGNGSQLTGIDATSIQNGNSNVKVAANGNVSISVTGNSNIVVVTDTGVNVAGYLTSTGNITAPYFIGNVQGNISGNIVVPGANTQILFNNDGNAGASANLTFDKDTGLLTVNGNIDAVNADLGNLVVANFVDVASNVTTSNLTVNLELAGNTANFSGNVGVGNLSTAQVLASTSITAPQLISNVSTGTAPFVVTSTTQVANLNVETAGLATYATTANAVAGANVSGEVSFAATANAVAGANVSGEVSFAATANSVAGANVSGQVGNALVAGTVYTNAQPNITSVGTLTSLTVSGNATVQGNVVTDYIRGRTNANIQIDAFAGNNSIVLAPTGTGTVDVNGKRVTNSADPVAAKDLATKEYVDTIASSALHYHSPVTVESPTALNATYNQPGGAGDGVGATLTNAGANVALEIDGVALSLTNRVLVYTQANAAHNGVYTVTTVGDGSTAWVLTRATDADTYGASDPDGLGAGDAFYVLEGDTGAGELYVMNTAGTITFGTTDINFVQISSAQIYNAGTGLDLTGVTFSIANTLVTPSSYGDAGNVATFTVNQQGQLTAAGEVSIEAPASGITGTTLSSNVVTSSLTTVGTLGSLSVTGNIIAANISANANLVVSNATVNLALVGNTANFSGNLTAANANLGNLATANFFTGVLINGTSNVTVNNNGNINLRAGGNTTAVITATGANITGYANITGNVAANNLSLTNEVSANIANIATRIDLGNTDIGWATLTTTSITANQTIATFAVTGVTGVEFLVKGVDSSGSKYSVATVQAVTDGSDVDYSTFATVNLGGTTGTLAVNISGSNITLQVTPSSTNSTVWTTQFRTI